MDLYIDGVQLTRATTGRLIHEFLDGGNTEEEALELISKGHIVTNSSFIEFDHEDNRITERPVAELFVEGLPYELYPDEDGVICKHEPESAYFNSKDLLSSFDLFNLIAKNKHSVLKPEQKEWLHNWKLTDLRMSPMKDEERKLIRQGHHIGWFEYYRKG